MNEFLFRVNSCDFVDRFPRVMKRTIHEITRNDTKLIHRGKGPGVLSASIRVNPRLIFL